MARPSRKYARRAPSISALFFTPFATSTGHGVRMSTVDWRQSVPPSPRSSQAYRLTSLGQSPATLLRGKHLDRPFLVLRPDLAHGILDVSTHLVDAIVPHFDTVGVEECLKVVVNLSLVNEDRAVVPREHEICVRDRNVRYVAWTSDVQQPCDSGQRRQNVDPALLCLFVERGTELGQLRGSRLAGKLERMRNNERCRSIRQ